MGKSFPEEKRDLLEQTSYFEILRKRLFNTSQYEYPNGITQANSNCYAFVHYINVFGLDEESVMCINQIFSFATFGPFVDAICKMMKNDEKLSDYQNIASENNLNDYTERFSSNA